MNPRYLNAIPLPTGKEGGRLNVVGTGSGNGFYRKPSIPHARSATRRLGYLSSFKVIRRLGLYMSRPGRDMGLHIGTVASSRCPTYNCGNDTRPDRVSYWPGPQQITHKTAKSKTAILIMVPNAVSGQGRAVTKKAYIDTADGQLHYHYSTPVSGLDAGNYQRAPILLLHMSASSSQCFISMMQSLSEVGFACFAPDMPGFGSSFDPELDPPSISWYADLYHATFSHFAEFKQGCHIVGHHSGGVIGIELAAKYTGFCLSLTAVGPTVMSAEDRLELSKTFLDPFNKPVASGSHLLKTWEYLRWEGIPEHDVELMQREVLDHVRAWKGRSQIYACVWEYDCEEAMKNIEGGCKILGLCAKDDVLWPYFNNFKAVDADLTTEEIQGGNFGPDLDSDGIVKLLMPFIDRTEA